MTQTTTDDLHACGMCGGMFPLMADRKEDGLFGHPCETDDRELARLRSREAVEANIERPRGNVAGRPRPSAPRPSGLRANKYPGSCVLCTGHVKAGEGTIEKKGDRWLVQHRPGQCGEIPAPRAPLPVTDGKHIERGAVHVIDGEYFRVHIGQRSGFPYAVRCNVIEPATWKPDGRLDTAGRISWERMPGLIKRLTPATLASAAEAAQFGKLVGRCCFCSTPIDTPESTSVGYGPDCADKYGLPWGSRAA